MARKLAIGMVLEVPTPCGYAYVQYAHEHEIYGSLVRVLPGHFRVQPGDLATLVAGPERFWMLHLVQFAARDRLMRAVGIYDLPEHAKRVPPMRRDLWGNGWSILEGWDREVARVQDLDEEQRFLAQLSIWPYPDFVRAIASDWSWADEVTARGQPRPPAAPCHDIGVPWPPREDEEEDEASGSSVTHYVYFPDRDAAAQAKGRVAARGDATIQQSAEGDSWLLLVRGDASEADDLEDVLVRTASELGGEYDGTERRIG